MSKVSVFTLFAAIMLSSLLFAVPEIPTAFYGVITTTSGTPNGQTLTATINGSSSTYVVGNTSVFLCTPSNCNYYLNAARPDGDNSSTNVVFTINGHNIGNGTFVSGGVVRLDFSSVPASYLACLLTTCSDGSCQATCPGGSGTSTTTTIGSGGGSTGGAGSPGSTKLSTDYVVDIGTANCTVSVKREMISSNVSSVLTTTLENKGGSECSMTEFVFTDTIPDSFPAGMNEINFTPAYTSREGWKVTFNFPSFAGGESKSLTYAVGKWVRPSIANNFTTVTLSAKQAVAITTTPVQNATQPVTPAPEVKPVGADKDAHGCIGSAGYTWCEAKQKCLRSWEEACTAPAPSAPAQEAKKDNTAQLALIAAAILLGIAVVAGAVFFFARKKHKGL